VIGLGIDTGGTFTDAAIVDMDAKKVLGKAKSPTTYEDLGKGVLGAIRKALAASGVTADQVAMVGISTTLATNSVLTGKGGRVGLIGIGWTPDPDWMLGFHRSAFVKGGYDSYGKPLHQMSIEEVEAAVLSMADDVDAFAISGIFSISNPWQEEEVRGVVERLTTKPTVLGHTLTTELGIMERTVTAVLNARLLPIISDFLHGVKAALESEGFHGRVLVFKGDGGLMDISTAMFRPVETVMSGPAASLLGASALSNEPDCLTIDIGGTSTDIAFLDEGFPRLSAEGAVVGQWRTRVKAVDMWTCGLGGDSHVRLDKKEGMVIGPERVVPVSVACARFPGLLERAKAAPEVNYYFALRDGPNLKGDERRVLDALLKNGPSSFFETMDHAKDALFVMDSLLALKSKGLVLMTGITPTDAMQVLRLHEAGDAEGARFAVSFLGEKMDTPLEKMAEAILRDVTDRMAEEIAKKAVADAGGDIPASKGFTLLLRSAATFGTLGGMKLGAKIDRPIIGIGAPAGICVKPLEERMDCRVIIPEGHEVGNAVGAVCSMISESVSVKVYPRGDDGFLVYPPSSEPFHYAYLEQAKSAARTTAERYATDKVRANGAEDIKVRVNVREVRFSDGYGKEMKFINWVEVKATASGRPKLDWKK
jgi:N-methylhydantoinase A/oxoprolinase/acetone carboxylase beta subunit